MLSLVAWARWPEPWWLVVTAAAAVGWTLLTRPGRIGPAATAALLLSGVVAGFWTHHRSRELIVEWDRIWPEREARAAERLSEELDALLRSGEEAVDRLAALPDTLSDTLAIRELRSVRRGAGVTALALYGPEGGLRVWDGTHRGAVPPDVRRAAARYAYGERPLFSYLYVTAAASPTGGTAVAAVLLRGDLPSGLEPEEDAFASRFQRRTGVELRISRSERAGEGAVWDLRWNDSVLFSVSLGDPDQAGLHRGIVTRGIRIAGALALLSWGLLALTAGGGLRRVSLAASVLLAVVALLPLGRALGSAGSVFSPAAFLLPGPLGGTLGRTAALGAAAVLGLGAVLARGSRPRPRPLLGLAVILLGFPAAVALFRGAPAPDFLAEGQTPFLAYQATLGLVLALVAVAGLYLASERRTREGPRSAWLVATGCALAVLLSGAVGLRVRGEVDVPLWVAGLWVLPAALLVRGRAGTGSRRRLLLWLGAASLAASCAVPFAWSSRTAARMEVAETRVGRLGTPVDPFMEFLLHRLASDLESLHREGAAPVELIYRGWTRSGLAREGVPVWITLWTPAGLPREELRVGLAPPRPALADDFLEEVRESGTPLVRRFDMADAHYVAFVPLDDGQVVSAVIPPRKSVDAGAALGPLFAPLASSRWDALTLVPLLPGDVPTAPVTVQWGRTDEGWRAERTVAYPEGLYHAHYLVDLSGRAVGLARGTLLIAGDLALVLLLVGIGVLVARGSLPSFSSFRAVAGTFQARVTVALFAFFLLSLAIFGTLAYRTLAGAAGRTATALAERVADEAAGWYLEVQGSMDLLARRVGADLLEYREGALVGGSVSELVELGLYRGWVPYDVNRALNRREALRAVEPTSLGRWDYVMAYRRLPDGDVLASPVPLRAGGAALRRQEVADLLGFAVLLGAALSLGLALLVGRTLSRPIHTLRVASERVGRGDMDVELPAARADEFGAVFAAFNRMVARLGRARRDLIRTSRRTQAIVEEAATGVVALDSQGAVTLVNPRAEELLDTEIRVGRPLPARVEGGAELLRWVELYFRDGLREAGSELQLGERRIRIRARRITTGERLGGAVISLEDVTDELRTERILAWGEMAQQVAHEVKNPLTPIKLSVQHIRRAWEDRREDFGAILERNIEAILREIERLASIARSFSHFGAPRAAGELPLEAVSVDRVVEETLDLYATDEGRVRFRMRVPEGLPEVRGRQGELKEVLVNLLENARAAISEEGTVLVEAEAADGEVELRVRDDGQGIPPELLSRIFEPHFSTRSSGTGLGLAIVRRLVESWGGTVEVESRPDEETTVRVVVPIWTGDGG